MNHTPGSWEISRCATPNYAPQYAVYAGPGPAVAMGVDSEANARLISAAPDMYRALVMLTDTIAFQFVGPVEKDLILESLNKAKGNWHE